MSIQQFVAQECKIVMFPAMTQVTAIAYNLAAVAILISAVF